MAEDDEPVENLPVARTPTADLSTPGPAPRLDGGDADQRVGMAGAADVTPEEAVVPVDAPPSVREPFNQAEKRRNQRRMPT